MTAAKDTRPGVPKIDPEVWYEYEAERGKPAPNARRLQYLLGRMVETHKPLMVRYLRRFMSKWSAFGDLPDEDMGQAALLGLVEAIQTHNPSRGAFSGWVALKVKVALAYAAKAEGVRTRSLPLTAAKYREVQDFEIKHGRPARPEDVGVSEKRLRNAQFHPKFCELGEFNEPTYELPLEELLDMKRLVEIIGGPLEREDYNG